MPDAPALDAANGDNLSLARRIVTPAMRERELEALYRSHFGKVTGYFQRCGQTSAAAHELAQDVFVSALRGLPDFRGDSKLSTWMWTIARHVLLAHLRSPKPLDLADHDDDVLDALTDSSADPLKDQYVCVRHGFALFSRDHPDTGQRRPAPPQGTPRPAAARTLGDRLP